MRKKKIFAIIASIIIGVYAIEIRSGIKHEVFALAKAKQAEAKTALIQVATLAFIYQIENGTYEGMSLEKIKFDGTGMRFYKVTISQVGTDSFQAVAKAQAKMIAACAGEDVWTIDGTKELTHKTNGMAKCK